MNTAAPLAIFATDYNRAACQIGVVHLGFGAFHRAHQAVYIDDYMQATGDLRWGIAAVNLRAADAGAMADAQADIARHDGYFLKTVSAEGQVVLRRVRAHVAFADWAADRAGAEALVARTSVYLITLTVTESGYYTGPDGALNVDDAVIAAEIAGGQGRSVYGYLRGALTARMKATGAPITIACCDNIRQNGKMLGRNLVAYLRACGDGDLAAWVQNHAAFPCSMVDRITPRSPASLATEMSVQLASPVRAPIMAEDFIQWVLQDSAAAAMPDLAKVGVTVTPDVDPFEETKIRVLNGGHTALVYLAALEGVITFDAAMRLPHLLAHFQGFETGEVLPALTLDLPFSKHEYLDRIARRFGNAAIGDTVARIAADGMAKFPIFIRPTLTGCLQLGIVPHFAIRSIASWYVFARHVAAGKIPFEYLEPSWEALHALLGHDEFVTSARLWADLPQTYPIFAETLRREISEMELKWPV
jgi:D-arabinitol 4-dehydrogenase